MSSTTVNDRYVNSENRRVEPANGTAFAYEDVSGSTGVTPRTISEMSPEAIVFLDAPELAEVDLLGFSSGSFAAPDITLTWPALAGRLVLASSSWTHGAEGHGWAKDMIGAVGKPTTAPEGVQDVSYTPTPASRGAGKEPLQRIFCARTDGRDPETTWPTRQAQCDAVCLWGESNHALLQPVRVLEGSRQ